MLLLIGALAIIVGAGPIGSTSPGNALAAPTPAHPFGTDAVGGDMMIRTFYGARVDVGLAMGGTALSLILGTIGGLIVSIRGRLAEYAMRALDAFQAFPVLILALVIVGLGGNNVFLVVVAIAIVNVPRYMRLLRTEILGVRQRRFIEASQIMGASQGWTLVRHILPNIRGLLLAQTSLTAANGIVIVASLSFLGVGVQPPTPSWGVMIRQGLDYQASGVWWVTVFPTIGVILSVLSFNLIANGIGSRYEAVVSGISSGSSK